MRNPEQTTLAKTLRKIAAELRKEDSDITAAKNEKCAHVLVAAKGLATLRSLISGGQK